MRNSNDPMGLLNIEESLRMRKEIEALTLGIKTMPTSSKYPYKDGRYFRGEKTPSQIKARARNKAARKSSKINRGK